MQRSFWLIIGIWTMFFLSAPVVYGKMFPDVPSNYKYYTAINTLSDAEIISGYEDGNFKPEKTINRAQAVTLLARFVSADLAGQIQEGETPFFDVKPGGWYVAFITWAYLQGVVEGYPDGSFRPDKTLNFAEGLKIILTATHSLIDPYPFSPRPLLAVEKGDWFAPYFTYAYEKNLINRDKFYHPRQPMTRGEFAEILYRLGIIEKEDLAEYPKIDDGVVSGEYTITIPRLNIFSVNVSFADPYSAKNALETLKTGLGHYLAPPEEGKKMIIFGHSSGYSWDKSNYKQILRQIDRLQAGDKIYINYHEKGYIYTIDQYEIMPAKELDNIMTEDNINELVLYTCWPPDRISHRYVVYGKPN